MRRGKGSNKDGVQGVLWRKDRKHYEVTIKVKGKTVYLGASKDFSKACKIREEGEKKYYTELFKELRDKEWRDIRGFEGAYKVNREGDIVSIHNGYIYHVRGISTGRKRGRVNLCKDGENSMITRGRIVLEAFGPPKPTDYHAVARFKDKDVTNAHIDNLFWGRTGQNGERLNVKGKEYANVAALCREMGFKNRNATNQRMKAGWSREDALEIPKKAINGGQKAKLYEYEGKEYTIDELSKKTGINAKTLQSRIRRWRSIDTAIGMPIRKTRKEEKNE